MEKLFERKEGITLIALVITIIVMLILVGVTINIAVNGRLFEYARKASKETEFSKDDEKIQVVYTTTQMSKYLKENKNFSDEIKKEFGEDTKVIKNEDTTYTVILPNGNKHEVGDAITTGTIVNPCIDATQIEVCGYDISLAGDTSVIIYFHIPEEKFTSKQEKIKITNAERTGEDKIEEVNVIKDNFRLKTINDNNYYCITYKLKPYEMTDNITVCAYDGETQDSDNYTFTMKNVGNNILNKIGDTNNKLKNYIIALLNYGAYYQEFVHSKSQIPIDEYANDGVEIDEEVLQNIMDELAHANTGAITENTFNENYIAEPSVSHVLGNLPTIGCVIRSKVENEKYTLYVNGIKEQYEIIKPAPQEIIRLTKEIPLEAYNDEYNIVILNSNNEEVANLKTSIADRLKTTINSPDTMQEMKNVVAAFRYAQKAYIDLIN